MSDPKDCLIGTTNPYKAERLTAVVSGFLRPMLPSGLPDIEEVGSSFKEIAENKAIAYSLLSGGIAVASDGGAAFPGLKEWDPLKTRRFIDGTDEERIAKLLDLMRDVTDRTVEWHEALAVAENGRLLFSASARAMDGVIATKYEPDKYREGMWLCSITGFPQFGNRNYFDLSADERAMTEDSWEKLGAAFREFAMQIN